RGHDAEQATRGSLAMVERELPQTIEAATRAGQGERDQVRGVVVWVTALPGETEDLFDRGRTDELFEQSEGAIQTSDQRSILDPLPGSEERDRVRRDAELGQTRQALRIASRGPRSPTGAICQDHALNGMPGARLGQDSRRHGHLVILMSEDAEDGHSCPA